MRGEVHILVHCPIDILQWGSTHSAMIRQKDDKKKPPDGEKEPG